MTLDKQKELQRDLDYYNGLAYCIPNNIEKIKPFCVQNCFNICNTNKLSKQCINRLCVNLEYIINCILLEMS